MPVSYIPNHILVVDDEPAMRAGMARVLAAEGYQVLTAASGGEALGMMAAQPVHLAILDMKMPGMGGVELLQTIGRDHPGTRVIMVTGYPDVEAAVACIKLGALDYLVKPLTTMDFDSLLEKTRKLLAQGSQDIVHSSAPPDDRRLDFIVGQSPAMQKVFDQIRRAAPSDSTILISGESGTGKELVARAIHQLSQRADQEFVAVDCSALVPSLLESELFGHVKGSFTGADANKIGKFELAQNGTLFFDEISNIGLEVQAKLLRAVEERKISKVGSHRVITVDVRLLAATNKDLARAIKDGTFREDLFYRLNVVLIQMPPLRERQGDIPLLVQHFLEQYNARLRKNILGLAPEALDLLVRHNWPGNVRELENTMERLVVLSRGPYLTPADLSFAGTIFSPATTEAGATSLKDLERDHIILTLQHCGGHKSETAQALGIDRKTLREKLKRYNIE
jgi:DNA-binding NtrC family response regulator